MGLVLAQLVLIGLLVGLGLVVVWGVRAVTRPAGPPRLPEPDRAALAQAVAAARWAPAHDEVDGVTRVLLRRSCTGPDGLPMVIEQRVFDTIPPDDPAWEARFTEAMVGARYRCSYLNAEEGPG